MAKTLVLSDESINSYGYRVLTSGIDLKNFRKNPIMLFNHERMSWQGDVYNGPIGYWENIRIEDGKLMADAVIDEEDPKGKIIANKLEKNFIRAASIGFKLIELSEDKKHLLPGQTRPTVTKCELVEVSIVDVPANKNALALYDDNGNKIDLTEEAGVECLNGMIPPINKELNPKSDMKLNIKTKLVALMGFLNLKPEDGKESVEHELTDAQLEDMNTKLAELGTLQTQLADATTAKEAAEKKLSDAEAAQEETDTAIATALKAAKLDGEQKGKEGVEALKARIDELGKLSGKFPLDNNEEKPLETNKGGDDEDPKAKQFNEAVAELRAEMGMEETK